MLNRILAHMSKYASRYSLIWLSLAFGRQAKCAQLTDGQMFFSSGWLQTKAYVSKCVFTCARSPSSVRTITICFYAQTWPIELAHWTRRLFSRDSECTNRQWVGVGGKQPPLKFQGHIRAFSLLT